MQGRQGLDEPKQPVGQTPQPTPPDGVTVADAAARYVERGFHPVPIPFREKAPKLAGWQTLMVTKADLPHYFNGSPSNVGLLLGDDYGTADVDLDCPEARVAALELLPETGMLFGRASSPKSHYFYRSDPPVRSRRFISPLDRSCLVELRCRKSDGTTGLQTVVPPSVHPSGEEVRFEPGGDGHPANVDAGTLLASVADVAAVSLLARHWPGEGSRNAAFLALAGALARAGWTLERAAAFHRALYRILWKASADVAACDAEVIATFEKHAGGLRTTGRVTLFELMDNRAVNAAFGWLDLKQRPPQEGASPKATRVAVRSTIKVVSLAAEDLLLDDTILTPALAIEGVLPERGLVLLGGRPKCGKSWLACQIALAFVTGQPLGGWLRIRKPGRCQLWALEDGLPITKDKLAKLLRGSVPDGLRDLRIFPELGQPILRGGDEIVRAALREYPSELLILDSLFKLTGSPKAHDAITQTDYDCIDRVRKIALDHGAVALIPMHTRKGARGGAPIENLMGTTGNTAAADVACELSRTGRNAKLTVVGRMVGETTYELQFHEEPEWGWTIEGSGDEAALGETSEEVLAFLEAQGAAKPATIAAGIRKSFGAAWMALRRLQERGKVVRQIDKKWTLPK